MKFLTNIGIALALLECGKSALAFQPASIHNHRLPATSLSAAVNNNIVLRPSGTDEDAFDNLKVGGCRVHRYRRENEPDSETEYVMWYHGRSVEQDSDKTLPPLSTGRIGRATSRNGLSWKKDVIGSEAEDIEGVSLGLNKESWWGFDTAHAGLGSVLLPMSTPALMMDGGVYLMYYMGGSFDETPIGDYVDREMPADATIRGMKMKIGVCVSQDGQTWGRVEGDDPSGACITPYDKNDVNTKEFSDLREADGSPIKLEEELYVGWPEVLPVINEEKATESGFFMYYSTMTKANKEKVIGCSVSSDGFRWEPRGICLRPDEGTPDAGGVARCGVYRNAVYDESTGAWEDASGYVMYYEGVSKEDNKHRIMMAVSDDGRSWTKKGVVLDIGTDDSWDAEGVGSPNILRYVSVKKEVETTFCWNTHVRFSCQNG